MKVKENQEAEIWGELVTDKSSLRGAVAAKENSIRKIRDTVKDYFLGKFCCKGKKKEGL